MKLKLNSRCQKRKKINEISPFKYRWLKNSSIEISDKIVKQKINYKLIKFVIDWQLNHAKPRLAKTKQKIKLKDQQKNCSTKRERWCKTC